MRPRINNIAKIDIQSVINELDHKKNVYSQMIRHTMKSENLNYMDAKKSLHFKIIGNLLFKC